MCWKGEGCSSLKLQMQHLAIRFCATERRSCRPVTSILAGRPLRTPRNYRDLVQSACPGVAWGVMPSPPRSSRCVRYIDYLDVFAMHRSFRGFQIRPLVATNQPAVGHMASRPHMSSTQKDVSCSVMHRAIEYGRLKWSYAKWVYVVMKVAARSKPQARTKQTAI
jgi:hypothetical protein